MRIVSLLPSATEILFALDLGEQVVGVTDGCDHPPEARRRPVVVHGVVDPSLPSREIHHVVSRALATGQSLYVIDVEQLRALRPDLIVTQELCHVCAVDPADVRPLVEELPGVQLLALHPSTLGDVLDDIRRVARAAGVPERGQRLARALERRIHRLAEAAAAAPDRPRVACVEWLDPPFVAGHWVPEMVALAGGVDVLGVPGQPSRQVQWEDVAEADPDVLVLMPCGFSLSATRARLPEVVADPAFRSLRAVRTGQVYAVDAGAYFSRPGPRLVEGLEILAGILHPGQLGEPPGALRLSPRDLGAAAPRVEP